MHKNNGTPYNCLREHKNGQLHGFLGFYFRKNIQFIIFLDCCEVLKIFKQFKSFSFNFLLTCFFYSMIFFYNI